MVRPAFIGHIYLIPLYIFCVKFILTVISALFVIRKHDLDLHCLHLSKSRGTGSLRDVRNAKEPRRGG